MSQSNILYPLHCPERHPSAFPFGSRFNGRRHDCNVFERDPDHQCCDKPTCCEYHGADCCFDCNPPVCVPGVNATYIQNVPVALTAPQLNQVLEFNGTTWIPATITSGSPVGPASGDLAANYPDPLVVGLQGFPLASTTPVVSALPIWDGSVYEIRPLTADDILPGFSITGFAGGSVIEVGASVVNPVFTASYSNTPNSAKITNTDNIGSPLVLSMPFTSGTVIGTFQHNIASSTTFTLTAVSTSTKTATQSIAWEARSFGGVGGAGASSATASGTTAVLNASLGTLNSVGLHTSDVGQTYGPFSPTAQKIYLLLPHTNTPHTFKDGNGFTFVMNAPTTFSFTNQNSASISMDLYESTLALSTTFSITVVS